MLSKSTKIHPLPSLQAYCAKFIPGLNHGSSLFVETMNTTENKQVEPSEEKRSEHYDIKKFNLSAQEFINTSSDKRENIFEELLCFSNHLCSKAENKLPKSKIPSFENILMVAAYSMGLPIETEEVIRKIALKVSLQFENMNQAAQNVLKRAKERDIDEKSAPKKPLTTTIERVIEEASPIINQSSNSDEFIDCLQYLEVSFRENVFPVSRSESSIDKGKNIRPLA